LRLLSLEGAGEVQTPLEVRHGHSLRPGDPVFFRHAKAGELAEHFTKYLLVRGARLEASALTYRGLGECFLG
jgi:D-serine deaminase-like pyridoxal phosphate-dependent protein